MPPIRCASTFALDYPRYEILFCVASAKDPVVPLVERLIADHAGVQARLLIGDERISSNPKLNNVLKGWAAAAHDWIILADSNVLMPPNYIQRLFASWRDDTGLVASPPVGCRPDGFWAELECAFLNTYQARWQYAADALGFGFCSGQDHAVAAAPISIAPEALPRSRAKSPKMRRRPKSSAAPVSKCGWSIARSRSRSVGVGQQRSGIGNCAGRGCAARVFCFISCRRFFPAACCR